MAKKKLLSGDFMSEFRIWGIFCHENDYRLSWLLNQNLGFDFIKTQDYPYFDPKKNVMGMHSVFSYRDPILWGYFFLVKNKDINGNPILTKPNTPDYLLIIKGEEKRYNFPDFNKKLRVIPHIMAIYNIDELIGSKREPLLYDFEMFVNEKLKISV